MARASTLTIVLASTLPAVFVLVIVLAVWRFSRRRNLALFNRGITPIADEEIESWKTTEKNDEGESYRGRSMSTQYSPGHHAHNSSVSSAMKPSVIVYQNPNGSPNQSDFAGGQSPPRSLLHKLSMDLPQTPILARAPNSRPGLTDEAIQGDDAFIPQLRRQPSRLYKSQSGTPTRPQHNRHRSAYTENTRDRWYGQQPDGRQSSDGILPRRSTGQRGNERLYSESANPPRLSLDQVIPAGGLVPQPIHRSEIGRAIG
jgi:hypothetical protein